ncbi:shikimate kinase [Pseudohaliea rubra]|uniref:Shikimate kinase n=1 Tax=Pseudohaliea rubra DSM 19751 TaxID=1265313 RepID=A0A095VUV8_9GAMM|nr:shikimate kinase [Pseudohaliea rubra]KGE04858.1 Shikimate kinase I [Pseudohaliea rubra DSM 19751]
MPPIDRSHRTISLIGMPGAGKSTVGVILAKRTGLAFTDTDLAIQVREGEILQDIVDRVGNPRFREIEETVLLEVPLDDAVVSTGGSVIYSDAVMQRLRTAGPVVFLEADLATLEERVAANPLRGIARGEGQSYADVYAERCPLYQRYADITVDATAGSADAVADAIFRALP